MWIKMDPDPSAAWEKHFKEYVLISQVQVMSWSHKALLVSLEREVESP
jgi:hypothetical protein